MVFLPNMINVSSSSHDSVNDPTSWHLCCDKGLCNRLAAVSDLESSNHGEFSTVAATFKSSNKGPHSPASSGAKEQRKVSRCWTIKPKTIVNWSSFWKILATAKHPQMAVTRDSRVQRQLLWLPPLPVPGTSGSSSCEKYDIVLHLCWWHHTNHTNSQ